MEYSLSKVDAAVDQLNWSINLFLDYQAYVPAITLAGAAEEIIGGILQDQSAFAQLKAKLMTDYHLPGNMVSQQHLNKAKNWLKHWKDMDDDEAIILELEGEAVQYILRAILNLFLHNRPPSEGPRFFEWLAVNVNRLNLDT